MDIKNKGLNKTDYLAIERTKLANERTFLAYFRTFVVILSSGFAVMKIQIFSEFKSLGFYLILVSIVLLIIGLFRFLYVKKQIKKFY